MERLCGELVDGRLVGLEATRCAFVQAIDDEEAPAGRCVPGNLGRHLVQRARGDQHLRAAVVHDVGGFWRGQVAVHRGEVEAGSERGPEDLEVAEMVLEENRHMVAAAQPLGPEELR